MSNAPQTDCIYAVYKGQHGLNVMQSVVIDSAMYVFLKISSLYIYVHMYATKSCVSFYVSAVL